MISTAPLITFLNPVMNRLISLITGTERQLYFILHQSMRHLNQLHCIRFEHVIQSPSTLKVHKLIHLPDRKVTSHTNQYFLQSRHISPLERNPLVP